MSQHFVILESQSIKGQKTMSDPLLTHLISTNFSLYYISFEMIGTFIMKTPTGSGEDLIRERRQELVLRGNR